MAFLLSPPLVASTPADRHSRLADEMLLGGIIMKQILVALTLAASMGLPGYSCAQAWRDCIPNSIGPGGCDSIGPGGGKSMGPGGGLSMGAGGGLSMGPGGGQSMGPGGGLSIAPGGGLGPDRDRSRGLDPRTIQPFQPLQQW